MKSKVLLVANADSSSNRVIEEAVAQTGRGLRHASTSRDAFEILNGGLDEIDAVIVDLDPGMHSLSILEAISYCRVAPPVIVVTGLEEMEMAPIAHRHGAAACISKPFNGLELSHVLNRVCADNGTVQGQSCDMWGHPKRAVRGKKSA